MDPIKQEEPQPADAAETKTTTASTTTTRTRTRTRTTRTTRTTKMETGKTQAPAPSPRRSCRERVSTTMTIQGHTVLRRNNYRVQGMTYVYDDHQEDVPRHNNKPSKARSPAQKAAYVEPPHETLRKRHNEAVEERVRGAEGLRQAFLSDRLELLRPFCDPAVLERLEKWGAERKEGSEPKPQPQPQACVSQPKMIEKAILRPYQLRGLEFMARMDQQNLGMILGDEMGLGKTLQTISLICHLKETAGVTGPSLILCPLSVYSSWCNEMKKWAPSLRFLPLHANTEKEQVRQRKLLAEHATEYDVVLTTYDMAKVPNLSYFFQRTKFHYLVLDEGHKIKGHDTIVAKKVRKIHAGNRLLLTGTPLQNNLFELWSLLNFLYPDVFTDSELFASHFDLSENVVDKAFLAKTQKLLEVFMLRRLKNEVEKLIPEKLETKVYCPLSKSQTYWYKALLMKDVGTLARMDVRDGSRPGGNLAVVRNLFMQLRKCSNHPFLFDGAEVDPNLTSLEDLVGASGKLAVLDMLLRSLFQKGHRAVLFTQFTSILDLIQDYCSLRGWKYCSLDGSTPRARRNYLLNRFNEPNSPYFLFLMSTRSGGMGLNLQTADTCILFDSDWNPQSDIQAMARVHRIGQKNKVHIYRLVTAGTVEERMLERAEKKLLLELVNKETKHHEKEDGQEATANGAQEMAIRGMSAGELLEDIKFGCEAIFGASSNNALPTEEEIASITDRARKESDSVGKLTGGTSKSARNFDAQKEFSDGQFFGGADFREIRRKQQAKEIASIPKNMSGIAHLWSEIKSIENKKRKRTSRLLQIEGKGTGYGKSFIPVLAANNYDYGGESSVFDRELRADQKCRFVVPKKKKGAPPFDSEDYCLMCGDGGSLVCCRMCPNVVHVGCAGLTSASGDYTCSHHLCVVCGKRRSDAGGLLFPCHACPNAYCEDHLPERGVTFLDKGVERYEKLGFDSTKHNVYINCSARCELYAIHELGYKPPNPGSTSGSCPGPMDLSGHFGTAYDLTEAASEVETARTAEFGRGKRRKGTRPDYNLGKKKPEPGTGTATPTGHSLPPVVPSTAGVTPAAATPSASRLGKIFPGLSDADAIATPATVASSCSDSSSLGTSDSHPLLPNKTNSSLGAATPRFV